MSVLILRVALLALAAAWFLAWPARAQALTTDEARSVIAPFYQALSAGSDEAALIARAVRQLPVLQ